MYYILNLSTHAQARNIRHVFLEWYVFSNISYFQA